MRYTEITESARVGTKKYIDGLVYTKQINGKWLIEPTPAVRDWLARLYVRKGLTLRALSEETGIPHASLQKLLNQFDLMRSKKQKAKSHIDVVKQESESIKTWNKKFVPPGKIARRISKKHGIDMCVWAFKVACARADVVLYTNKELRTKFLEKNFEKIKSQYVSGRSALSIAKAINDKYPKMRMTSTRIMDFLRQNNVRVRSQYEANLLVMERNLAAGRTTSAACKHPTVRQSWNHKLTADLSHLTYREYRSLVTTATRAAIRRFRNEYAHVTTSNQNLSIDHKFSVHDGYFKLNPDTLEFERRNTLVPISIIAHPENLHLIPNRTNRMKGSNSWISLKDLLHSVKRSKFQLEREH